MSNIKLSLLKYVDDVVTTKDARIAELEQQLAEANAIITGLQAQVDFAKSAMETMQDERDEDH